MGWLQAQTCCPSNFIHVDGQELDRLRASIAARDQPLFGGNPRVTALHAPWTTTGGLQERGLRCTALKEVTDMPDQQADRPTSCCASWRP